MRHSSQFSSRAVHAVRAETRETNAVRVVVVPIVTSCSSSRLRIDCASSLETWESSGEKAFLARKPWRTLRSTENSLKYTWNEKYVKHA